MGYEFWVTLGNAKVALRLAIACVVIGESGLTKLSNPIVSHRVRSDRDYQIGSRLPISVSHRVRSDREL